MLHTADVLLATDVHCSLQKNKPKNIKELWVCCGKIVVIYHPVCFVKDIYVEIFFAPCFCCLVWFFREDRRSVPQLLGLISATGGATMAEGCARRSGGGAHRGAAVASNGFLSLCLSYYDTGKLLLWLLPRYDSTGTAYGGGAAAFVSGMGLSISSLVLLLTVWYYTIKVGHFQQLKSVPHTP